MSISDGATAPITPAAFIRKWKKASLTERQAAHEHFLDLCALFGHPTPTEDDPTGERFAFEKGATKVGGGRGFADVWKRDHFAWEYKRKNGNLDAALLQLIRYAPALESPPLQVVCDVDRFRIHTAWTNTVPTTYEIELEDLAEPAKREILRNVFHAPEKLKPTKTRAAVTAEAADKFSTIASRLRGKGTADEIAHFVNQLVFCFFAQSVKLLPDGLFPKLLQRSTQNPERAKNYLNKLFEAMESGGEFDLNDIAWFNGGLFDGRRALPLDASDIGLLVAAGSLDWSLIDPTIFGTLFERFLDPDKRAQIGAHYTDQDKIAKIIDPVILRPLRAEWELAKQEITAFLRGERTPPMRKKPQRRMTKQEAAEEARSRYLERLRNLRILDPACGSGNFLYLALQGVKDLENKANLECEILGLEPRLPVVGPEIVRGIEINPLAAELARTTIWIGDIQWRLRNGIHAKPKPILRKLDAIEGRDALVATISTLLSHGKRAGAKDRSDAQYVEADWPEAEFIVGNPPFLGIRLMRQALGDDTVQRLFEVYDGRVSREADLVCYWFEKARKALMSGQTSRVGLVATNSIRGGANRKVLEQIGAESRVFEAWSDEPWVVDGAAVRVSLVCFGKGDDALKLDGEPVASINPDLSSTIDLTKARRLADNVGVAFMGDTKGGAFDIPGELARKWLKLPLNPNGRPNSDVLRPWRNGMDMTRRSRDMWIIDFGWEMSEREASLYEAPFQYIKEHVLPERSKNRRDAYRERWWRHVEPRPGMWNALKGKDRVIVTPEVSRHRVFTWLSTQVVPDHKLQVIARDDDTTLGILLSKWHLMWSLGVGSWHGVGNDPRYTISSSFETFPFPGGLTPNLPAARLGREARATAISKAARRLEELRQAWLNPAGLVRTEAEVVPGYPMRVVASDAAAEKSLRERTLTELYNQRPHWLTEAHRALDSAVASAYGWPSDISDDDALASLLALNLSRRAVDQLSKKGRTVSSDEDRRAPQFKLPISGGKQVKAEATRTQTPAKNRSATTSLRSRGRRKSA
ncbi:MULTISPECIES: class I SAM-dependent DNA methyltransferase [Bradyrhizobium]|uniref:Class I SAM-dependent DNA methyltransferase n=2 Tax=Bradyrhizobium quebecense TaxID=2748629 RepID=A0ACD3VHD0_9BRAD|nr:MULTISPECIES: class I SAM-dependent DNA methyltransferase [Bradyrhizobium]UFX46437.1 class I SAM-dependent DNA methyltransferase [Bradyrhizobium sp. 41S5]UGY05765.1 class I SAM-dependent DNA methyltransferase [Bradyrhizobium quebecense]